MLLSEIYISYSVEGQKPSNKRIASSAVPLWGSSARIGEGACQEARKHTVPRQRGAGHSAGKGCLSGMAEGEKRNSYNDRSCRGGIIRQCKKRMAKILKDVAELESAKQEGLVVERAYKALRRSYDTKIDQE